MDALEDLNKPEKEAEIILIAACSILYAGDYLQNFCVLYKLGDQEESMYAGSGIK